MKIAHTADVHIRGNQYLDEMAFTFDKFLESAKQNRCELLVIAGDLYHSKLTVTNEYFDTCRKFLKSFMDSGIKVLIIPGNHDLALNNTDRLDAITPVYNSLKELNKSMIHYAKNSGLIYQIENFNFWHFSCLDEKESWPTEKDLEGHKDKINIALYHGTIENSMVDSGWVSRGNKDDLSIFKGFDYAFLGDIHKHQFLSKTVAYPGSLRQNDYGEDSEKGYIFWDIFGKKEFKSQNIVLPQKRYFVTLEIDNSKSIENFDGKVPKNSRIRIKPTNKFSPSEETIVKELVKLKFKPYNDPTIMPFEDEEEISSISLNDGSVVQLDENIREEEVQKKLIKEYLFIQGVDDEKILKKIFELDKVYHSYVESVPRGVIWSPKKMEWSNLFSYGEKNCIDFSKTKGVVGIFGKTGAGKSSICDSLCFGLGNKINKENANKNSLYVNVRKSEATIKHVIQYQDKDWTVERKISNKKTKSGDVKTTNFVSFFCGKNSSKKNKNEEDLVQTNFEIQKTFGTIDDLVLTSIVSQFGLTNLIDAKKTERKKVYAKFFDLDIFENKFSLANEDFKNIKSQIDFYEGRNLAEELNSAKDSLEAEKKNLENLNEKKLKLEEMMNKVLVEISKLNAPQSLVTMTSMESLRKTIAEKTDKILKLKKEIDYSDLDNLENLKSLVKTNLEKQSILSQKNKEKISLQKKLVVLSEIPGQEICQSCSLVSDAYKSKPELEKIQEEILQIEKSVLSNEEIKSLSERIRKAELSIQKKYDIELLEASLVLEKSALDTLLAAFTGKSQEDDKQKLEKLERVKKELSDKISENSSSLFQSAKNQGKIEESIFNIKEQIQKRNEILSKFEIYQLYMKAMGKDGIAYMILSKKIPIIELEVNKILSQVVDFRFKIENDQKEKSINYFIVSKTGMRQAELASGGEKTIISIALRAALWKHCQLPKPNILFLDEPFGFLDVEKYDLMVNLLNYLKNYFKTIFVISHNEDLKTSMDSIIYIKPDEDGYSHVFVG